MGQGTAIIMFDCASGTEAADEVRGWTVAPNAHITLNYTETAPHTTADENGTPQEPPPPEQIPEDPPVDPPVDDKDKPPKGA
jgi:hypothetical protein